MCLRSCWESLEKPSRDGTAASEQSKARESEGLSGVTAKWWKYDKITGESTFLKSIWGISGSSFHRKLQIGLVTDTKTMS